MRLIDKLLIIVAMTGALTALPACSGLFAGVYDEPDESRAATVAGQLYVDASDWQSWHYIDLPSLADSVAADSLYNTSAAWVTMPVPMEETGSDDADVDGHRSGIYTYWYDVFGAGISVNEYRSFYPTAPQPEPERWTFAVHRNNVRTRGCSVAATAFHSFAEIPEDDAWFDSLTFEADSWSENEVWCGQERMLLGLIGNQGIAVNRVLSSWLWVDIPPVPPVFTLSDRVFILRLPDGTHAALQLEDYQSPAGVKCCLTINYRYPL